MLKIKLGMALVSRRSLACHEDEKERVVHIFVQGSVNLLVQSVYAALWKDVEIIHFLQKQLRSFHSFSFSSFHPHFLLHPKQRQRRQQQQ